MARVEPFAVLVERKKCFVWANDFNQESYSSLVDNIRINKVRDFVQSYNIDSATFIRQSAVDLLKSKHSVDIFPKTTL
jgi:tRNA (guanine37-N1)-methyltransferase